jgi:Holliday junction resolvasome RuvABC ATP-dependent DNA helicase subunit
MSFGFSIGDFLAVIKLANEARKAFVEAPAQFKSISDECVDPEFDLAYSVPSIHLSGVLMKVINRVRNLSLVLQDVEIDISVKELSSQQQGELQELSKACHKVLADILKKIEDYTELSTTNDGKRNMAKRVWKRLKWEPSDVQELRIRISTNIALLTAFNGQIMKRDVAKLVQHQDEEARQKVLNWLSPSNYATQQSDFLGRREEGTGQWFLDSSEFNDWTSGSKQTLFCPGIPGAGKTILASIVIDELYDRFGSGGEVAIAYLYCNFNRHDEQSAIGLLSNLLKQLAQSQPSLDSSIQKMYDEHTAKGTKPSMGEISDAIQVLSKPSGFAKVYVVIDALDECRMNDGSRTRFLDAMFELQDACNINLLATSRFIPEITERFKEKPTLEIRASRADVMRYLQGNLSMLPAFVSRNPELQTEISTEITRTVDGM